MKELQREDGNVTILNAYDDQVFDPTTSVPVDATGQPLKVGTKVAWGTAYRGGKGAAIGEIIEIGYKPAKYQAPIRTPAGQQVFENYTYEGFDYSKPAPRVKETLTGKRPTYEGRTFWRFEIKTKSLQSGRLGNTFNSPDKVVVISNQEFTGG